MRRAPLAFWLAAVSPLVFNAYVTWAHTLSAAVRGRRAVAMVRISRQAARQRPGSRGCLPRSPPVSSSVPRACSSPCAVLAVLAVVLVRTGRPGSVVAAVVPGAVLAVAMWSRAALGRGDRGRTAHLATSRCVAPPTAPAIVEGRSQGAWISVLRGSSPGSVRGPTGLILPVALVVVVVVVIRAARSEGHEVEGVSRRSWRPSWPVRPTADVPHHGARARVTALGARRRRHAPSARRRSIRHLGGRRAGGLRRRRACDAVRRRRWLSSGAGGSSRRCCPAQRAVMAAVGLAALVDARPRNLRSHDHGTLAALDLVAG